MVNNRVKLKTLFNFNNITLKLKTPFNFNVRQNVKKNEEFLILLCCYTGRINIFEIWD